jgi:dihydrofolate reductase
VPIESNRNSRRPAQLTRPRAGRDPGLQGRRRPFRNTTVLSADLAAAVGELKAKPAGELQVHGSGNLVRWLLDNELVDEITLIVCPVIVGQGTRLFPDAGPDVALDQVDLRATPKGVTIQVYRPTGRPRYAAATAG